ncbi:MAG: hypothetical protein H6983_18750 [Ectothiorhodospiraceae bacterium]|nr:hypothetical protein [Ectothiorhodospiraceae bacterium]
MHPPTRTRLPTVRIVSLALLVGWVGLAAAQTPPTPTPAPAPFPVLVPAAGIVPGGTVALRDGRVSVALEDAPLGAVLEALEAQGGPPFALGAHARDAKVTDTFSGIELEPALERLLREWNHVLAVSGQAPHRDVSQVHVLSARSARAPLPRPATTARTTAATAPAAPTSELLERIREQIAAALEASGSDLRLEDLPEPLVDLEALRSAGVPLSPGVGNLPEGIPEQLRQLLTPKKQ